MSKQKTMSASQVIKAVAEKNEKSAKDVKQILAAEEEVVHEALSKGDAVAILNGGGVALDKNVATRTVGNTFTGEMLGKPPGRAVKLKPPSALKSCVA